MELVTRTTGTQHLHGAPITRIPRKRDVQPTFPRGRHCSTSLVCDGKELSIYNEGPDCNQCSEHRELEGLREAA